MVSKFLLVCIISCLISNNSHGQDCLTEQLAYIEFSGYKSRLSKEIKTILHTVSKKIKENPFCNVAITGYPGSSQNEQLNIASWDRANKIMAFLREKEGITAERLIFKSGSPDDDKNVVVISFTEEKPNEKIAPHPNLRKNYQSSFF